MNLTTINWKNITEDEFASYLHKYSKVNRRYNLKGILNTNKEILFIPMGDVRKIVKEIKKGDYISFLNNAWFNYHELTIMYCLLLDEIKDFKIFEKYLNILSENTDSWSITDALPHKKLRSLHQDRMFELALFYHRSGEPFKIRFGTVILFSFIEKTYLPTIFTSLNSFTNEKHYYVNMANAWFLCESFIKEREMTLDYLENHKLNKFTINKTISKCRDSFRVSNTDKEMLIKYRM